MEKTTFALQMKEVSKKFPGTLAVDHVSFEVKPGEIHALMGENGAGKSTLMKILAGSFDNYTGEILIHGKDVTLHSPSEAKNEGIAMIYQELSIAYNRSVAENIFAGHLPTKGIFVDSKKLEEDAKRTLARVKLEDKINPKALMKNITQHEAQLIEIAKALEANPKILVMDEPTSSLSRDEVVTLMEIINQIKKSGMAIIYISHHLSEVFQIADRVTVMRDGKKIDTCDIKNVTQQQLVEMMVGEKVENFYKDATSAQATSCDTEVLLDIKNLTRYGFFHKVSFQLHKGEILGIGGLAGAGRTELGRSLVGADPIDKGEYMLDGKPVKVKSMNQMVKHGVSYLSENRKTEGLSLRLTIGENMLAAVIDKFCKFGFYKPKGAQSLIQDLFSDLQIYPPDPNVTLNNLSGGNQQKVLLAKWLATNPRLLILDEPTRGVDVGAKKTIHKTIAKLADTGVSVLLISSDLPELVSLSDRIMIMKQGHMVGEIAKNSLDENIVLLAANGDRSVLTSEYQ